MVLSLPLLHYTPAVASRQERQPLSAILEWFCRALPGSLRSRLRLRQTISRATKYRAHNVCFRNTYNIISR